MSRRLMLKSRAGVSPVLPAEYQRVEWIGNNNSGAYINSNIIPSLTDKIIFHLSRSANKQDQAAIASSAAGIYQGGSPHEYKFGLASLGSSFISGLNDYLPLIGEISEFEINLSLNQFRIENSIKTYPRGSGQNTSTLTIFSRMYTGFLKIHDFSMYNQNDETLINLIPCYRKFDSEIGMFDTVSQTFFTNAGTGAFTKGADV